jgi:hypothetical protein
VSQAIKILEVNSLKKLVFLSLSLLTLLILIPSCVTVQPQAAQPSVIGTFAASPSAINPGGTANLSWNVTGANSVTIDQGIGVVNASGTMVIAPTASTVYTLSATNSAGTVTSTAMATVNPVQPNPSAFLVTAVSASISPTIVTGACPRTFMLYATITANGPGTVTYRWERDDLRYSDVKSITFDAAGTQTTTTQWDFSETSSGYIRVHVLTNDVTSLPVNYSLTCGG